MSKAVISDPFGRDRVSSVVVSMTGGIEGVVVLFCLPLHGGSGLACQVPRG